MDGCGRPWTDVDWTWARTGLDADRRGQDWTRTVLDVDGRGLNSDGRTRTWTKRGLNITRRTRKTRKGYIFHLCIVKPPLWTAQKFTVICKLVFSNNKKLAQKIIRAQSSSFSGLCSSEGSRFSIFVDERAIKVAANRLLLTASRNCMKTYPTCRKSFSCQQEARLKTLEVNSSAGSNKRPLLKSVALPNFATFWGAGASFS